MQVVSNLKPHWIQMHHKQKQKITKMKLHKRNQKIMHKRSKNSQITTKKHSQTNSLKHGCSDIYVDSSLNTTNWHSIQHLSLIPYAPQRITGIFPSSKELLLNVHQGLYHSSKITKC